MRTDMGWSCAQTWGGHAHGYAVVMAHLARCVEEEARDWVVRGPPGWAGPLWLTFDMDPLEEIAADVVDDLR